MIAAERWYEYQKNYQKYGLDMKPQPERRTLTQKTQCEKAGDICRRRQKTALSLVDDSRHYDDNAHNNNCIFGKPAV